MDTFSKINEVLEGYLKGKELTKEATFKDLGIDSIDLVDIVVTMEEEFEIEFEDEELEQLKTVADLVALVDSKK